MTAAGVRSVETLMAVCRSILEERTVNLLLENSANPLVAAG
jgi:hypothetical protein